MIRPRSRERGMGRRLPRDAESARTPLTRRHNIPAGWLAGQLDDGGQAKTSVSRRSQSVGDSCQSKISVSRRCASVDDLSRSKTPVSRRPLSVGGRLSVDCTIARPSPPSGRARRPSHRRPGGGMASVGQASRLSGQASRLSVRRAAWPRQRRRSASAPRCQSMDACQSITPSPARRHHPDGRDAHPTVSPAAAWPR